MAALGLGKILGLGILSQFMGGGQKEQQTQQPTQVASSGQNQGFFPDMNNMSQAQWANTAIALNSMRLRPDPNLAAAMTKNIETFGRQRNTNATVVALKKMGLPNIAALVDTGALDVSTAMKYALDKNATNIDTKAVVHYLRNPKNENLTEVQVAQLSDLADQMELHPESVEEIMKAARDVQGIGGTALGIKTSMVFTDQTDGRQYVVKTNPNTGAVTQEYIDGATGMTEQQKIEMEQDQKALQRDEDAAFRAGTDAYQQSRDLRNQVKEFELAMSYVEDGALSGWLENKMYAMDDRTALLRGIQNKLGISVINSATFGALSEREMQMAMATNLNLDLKPEPLRQMILEQIRVRTKLAREYEFQADLLLREGGTYTDFITKMLDLSKKNDAVVWEELTPEEIVSLSQVRSAENPNGIGREEYKDKDYNWRRNFFDLRNK